jgi:FAD/FMN-containing dehydrogenase
LATTTGLVGHTGIAGLTLGGGLGRLVRKHGTSSDNLISADVVLADGTRVTASAEENADLFWGLRGGGGNFGIVTAFSYRLHPVGPELYGGLILYEWSRAGSVLRAHRDFCATTTDEVSADAAMLTRPSGEPVLGIAACYIGSLAEGERALKPLCEIGPPIENHLAPTPYTTLQTSVDGLVPRGRRYHWKTHLLKRLENAAIDLLIDRFAKVPSSMSLLVLTAYANRDAAFDCVPICVWEDPAQDDANLGWARELWDAMRPFASGTVYVNNLGEEGDERVRAAYGPNYQRLTALKTKYDPTHFFSAQPEH